VNVQTGKRQKEKLTLKRSKVQRKSSPSRCKDEKGGDAARGNVDTFRSLGEERGKLLGLQMKPFNRNDQAPSRCQDKDLEAVREHRD